MHGETHKNPEAYIETEKEDWDLAFFFKHKAIRQQGKSSEKLYRQSQRIMKRKIFFAKHLFHFIVCGKNSR